jgi:hypothetical protein
VRLGAIPAQERTPCQPCTPSPPESATLEQAIQAYLALGWNVIPVPYGTNTPNLIPWKLYQTERVNWSLWENWLHRFGSRINLAAVTGRASGLVVIDVDERSHGRESIEARAAELHPPATLTSRTPGGWHMYFAQNQDQETETTTDILPGVDIRGDGGTIILPPSWRQDDKYPDGAAYRWIRPIAPAPVPRWLLNLDLLGQRPKTARQVVRDHNAPDWVAELLESGTEQKFRNDKATALTGYFIRKGLPDSVILTILRIFGARCSPPMIERELTAMLRSVRAAEDRARELGVDPHPLEINIGSGFRYEFADDQVSIQFRDIEKAGDAIQSELYVRDHAITPPKRLLGPVHFNLYAANTQASHAKILAEKKPSVAWRSLLSVACDLGIQAWRAGDPITPLGRDDLESDPYDYWAIPGIALADAPAVLFGDGGSGKSLIASAVGIAIATGKDVGLGIEPTVQRRVLYLDSEWTKREHDERVQALNAGKLPDESFLYKNVNVPLWEIAGYLAEYIREHAIGFLILDSVAGLCGDTPEETRAAMRFFAALRKMGVGAGVGAYCIAHIGRYNEQKKDLTDKPFGSAYWHNNARHTDYIEKVQEIGTSHVDVLMNHRKANKGQRRPPLSYRLSFDGAAMAITRTNAYEIPGLSDKLSYAARFLHALRSGPRSLVQIREELNRSISSEASGNHGPSLDVVANIGQRLERERKVTHLQDGRYVRLESL